MIVFSRHKPWWHCMIPFTLRGTSKQKTQWKNRKKCLDIQCSKLIASPCVDTAQAPFERHHKSTIFIPQQSLKSTNPIYQAYSAISIDLWYSENRNRNVRSDDKTVVTCLQILLCWCQIIYVPYNKSLGGVPGEVACSNLERTTVGAVNYINWKPSKARYRWKKSICRAKNK